MSRAQSTTDGFPQGRLAQAAQDFLANRIAVKFNSDNLDSGLLMEFLAVIGKADRKIRWLNGEKPAQYIPSNIGYRTMTRDIDGRIGMASHQWIREHHPDAQIVELDDLLAASTDMSDFLDDFLCLPGV